MFYYSRCLRSFALSFIQYKRCLYLSSDKRCLKKRPARKGFYFIPVIDHQLVGIGIE